MDQNENIEELELVESDTEPEVVRERRSVSKGEVSIFRTWIFRAILIVYIIWIVIFGYWYWFRPVRSLHFSNAYEWWLGIADEYDFPVPEDDRWTLREQMSEEEAEE